LKERVELLSESRTCMLTFPKEVHEVVAYILSDLLYNSELISKSDESFAEVDTKIVTKQGEEFSTRYKLRRVDGAWKIYEVVAEKSA
jgi:hypothetical protein